MPSIPVGFAHGNAASLPQEIQEGTFLYTDDTNKLFLDINGERRDLIGNAVKSAIGSSQVSFVNMAGLDVGHYSLTGYYKYDSSSEIIKTSNVLDVIVSIDDETSKKVIVFPSVIGGEYYINKIIYNGTTVEVFEHFPISGGSAWGDF